jgi:hypothetical protein
MLGIKKQKKKKRQKCQVTVGSKRKRLESLSAILFWEIL